MSLLSDTRGTPHTVWAVVNLLNSNNGELGREALWGWMDPFNTGLDEHGKAKAGNVLDQTLGAAASLDLIETDRSTNTIRLSVSSTPSTLSSFSDWVHGRLTSVPLEHPDSVVLEAYAWLVASCAKNKGTTWIRLRSRNQLADAINTALISEQTGSNEDNRFNSTKLPRWRDWLGFMGLGLDMPTDDRGTTFYPSVTERMERELNKLRMEFGTEKEVEGSEFLSAIAGRMPYIDGGAQFNLAAKRIAWKPNPRQLSIVTSTALRDLHDDGLIELKMYGDTRDAYILSADATHRFNSFKTITLKATETADE
jgi:hypothetical protein